MTPAEKIIADNNVNARLTQWIVECQHDNRVPVVLLTLGTEGLSDEVGVLSPAEYPLPLVLILLHAATARIEAELAKGTEGTPLVG